LIPIADFRFAIEQSKITKRKSKIPIAIIPFLNGETNNDADD
jgi:hypothetical protein